MVSTEPGCCFRAMHVYRNDLTTMLTRLETLPAQIQTLLGDISEQKVVDPRKLQLILIQIWASGVGTCRMLDLERFSATPRVSLLSPPSPVVVSVRCTSTEMTLLVC